MTTICIIGDEILLDGATVGMLVPGLRLSVRDQLTELFDALDEDYIAELEAHVAQLEAQMKAPAERSKP
jgi:hypothetical protein